MAATIMRKEACFMSIRIHDLSLDLSYWQDGLWHPWTPDCTNGVFQVDFHEEKDGSIAYTMRIAAPLPSKLKMTFTPLKQVVDPFHLIPCCIYGDNNADQVHPGEFPLLTDRYSALFCSPVWEFRADRAAAPVSMLCAENITWGVSIDPYADTADGSKVRSGVFAKLPASFGVTLGYSNDPLGFSDKRDHSQPIGDSAREATVSGHIYRTEAPGRLGVHRIIRAEYALRRDKSVYRCSFSEAARGLFDSFVDVNWSADRGEYTNCKCRPLDWNTLRPWRSVIEIGWTGGAVLALPMLMYEHLTPGLTPDRYHGAMTAREQFDRICRRYNEASGLFWDLMTPNAAGSNVNGWWAGYMLKDCHCAYTNGSAAYHLLSAVDFLRRRGEEAPPLWLETAWKVVDTARLLQREDGAFGYTYATDRKEVLDWEGFAGCWFAAAAALLYRLIGENQWLDCAMKALRYYGRFVQNLNCWGTPMDTWKAVDQEGNLAFIRACSILWQDTRNTEVLKWFQLGAEYEYLWRYGYRTRPEYAPILEGWTACGGSVTSISNPHIHPMGVLVNSDLLLLAEATGDDYHRQRAEDGTAWLMQTLELYPEKTGYGQYGVLSERWCPSDGLLEERYADGRPYSSWFSYNLWAAANALQAVCERMADGEA